MWVFLLSANVSAVGGVELGGGAGWGRTAVCPYCSVDSVIGLASGLELTPEFLRRMHAYWFERIV